MRVRAAQYWFEPQVPNSVGPGAAPAGSRHPRTSTLASSAEARDKRGMSGHGHHDSGAESHADHDDHADETTSDDFPADEPRSPGWLPLLGGGLFLAAILAFVIIGREDKPSETAKEAVAPVVAQPSPALSARRPSLPGLRPG